MPTVAVRGGTRGGSLSRALATLQPGAADAAQAGDLDPSFAGDDGTIFSGEGWRAVGIGGTDFANDVLVQPDGKILAGGEQGQTGFTTDNSAMVRFTPAGKLDTGGFGVGGFRINDFGGSDQIEALALLPDGRILSAGTAFSSGERVFLIARYNADGSLDGSFGGGDGWLQLFVGVGEEVVRVRDIAVQPDGKILVAGTTECRAGVCAAEADRDFSVFRVLADGSGGDLGFGGFGGARATVDFGGPSDFATGIGLQDDGRIVVGGHASGDFAVARLNTAGSLDTTFGVSGGRTTDFGSSDEAETLLIYPDGKIVLAGGVDGDFGLARYTADGGLDASFAGDGKRVTDLGGSDRAFDIARQPVDGHLVAAGRTNGDFALARYEADGLLDPSFNGDGRSSADIGEADSGFAVALQADGKIIVAGQSQVDGSRTDFAVARFLASDDPSVPPGGGGGMDSDPDGAGGGEDLVDPDPTVPEAARISLRRTARATAHCRRRTSPRRSSDSPPSPGRG